MRYDSAMPPLVAVSATIAPASSRGPERTQLNRAYLTAVEAAGGLPVMLPAQLAPASLRALLATAGALVLTGGGDVDPARYNERPHLETTGVIPERDSAEAALIEAALDRDMPVLAICRGMQLLNVVLGGSLIQDIASTVEGALDHRQQEGRDAPAHAVRVASESALARLLGATEVAVNSMHHQAIKSPGRGLRPVAWAPDGVVEALELDGYHGFFAAVQWHPEEMAAATPHAAALFEAVVLAAR